MISKFQIGLKSLLRQELSEPEFYGDLVYKLKKICCTLLYVHSSIAIILMGKRELIALLNLSSWCLVMVERLFLAVPRGCLRFVIVVFPDHTHLLFLIIFSAVHYKKIGYNINVLQQTACLVVNPITVGNFAFLFNCTPVGRTSDSMKVPT